MAGIAPLIRAPSEGSPTPNPLGGSLTFKALARETDGSLTAFESRTPPGEGPPLHVHPVNDETIYVLEGSIRVRLGDEVHLAEAGSFTYFPRRMPHTWQSVGEAEARLLVCFFPAAPGMERFFSGVAGAEGEVFRTVPSGGEMEVLGPPLAESHPG
jgi:quercetin dioxygenase-like cupin family protein